MHFRSFTFTNWGILFYLKQFKHWNLHNSTSCCLRCFSNLNSDSYSEHCFLYTLYNFYYYFSSSTKYYLHPWKPWLAIRPTKFFHNWFHLWWIFLHSIWSSNISLADVRRLFFNNKYIGYIHDNGYNNYWCIQLGIKRDIYFLCHCVLRCNVHSHY